MTMDKPVVKEVIVVEGKSDTRRLKECFQCETIETNGSAISESVLNEIGVALNTHGVIVFTDPDYPGKQIRYKIRERYPDVIEAFLKRDVARSKKGKLGIEHASCTEIIKALQKRMTNESGIKEMYSVRDMQRYGLSGKANSKQLRIKVCDALNLEYSNANQLRNKLNRYGIEKQALENILEEVGESL